MKLKNKLIPITGIAAIAVTTPLMTLTSCKQSEDVYTTFDFSSEPTAESPRSVPAQFGVDEAVRDYVQANKNNGGLTFMNDYILDAYDYYLNEWIEYRSYMTDFNFEEYKVSMTTPVFGTTLVSYPSTGIAITMPTISFKVKYENVATYSRTDDGTKYNYKYTTNIVYSYNNIPFTVSSENFKKATTKNMAGTDTIHIGLDSSFQWYLTFMNDSWSFGVNGTRIQEIQQDGASGKTKKYTYNYDTYVDTMTKLNNLMNSGYGIRSMINEFLFNFESNYFSNCTWDYGFWDKGLCSVLTSPWSDGAYTPHPTVQLKGIMAYDASKTSEGWYLNNEEPIECQFVQSSSGTKDKELIAKKYKLVIPKHAQLVSAGSLSNYGTFTINDAYIDNTYTTTGETAGDAFDINDIGTTFYFAIPTRMFQAKNDTLERVVEFEPENYTIPVRIDGTIATDFSTAGNIVVQHDVASDGTWDGLVDVYFNYDAPTDASNLYLGNDNRYNYNSHVIGHLSRNTTLGVDETMIDAILPTNPTYVTEGLYKFTLEFVDRWTGDPITVPTMPTTEDQTLKIDFSIESSVSSYYAYPYFSIYDDSRLYNDQIEYVWFNDNASVPYLDTKLPAAGISVNVPKQA